jgi:thiol-disulfide isomerase/thioredoxin
MRSSPQLPALLLGTLLLSFSPPATERLQQSGKARVGDQAPPFGAWDLSRRTIIGLKQLLREPGGRPLLITFGASWCPPCNEGFPRLVALQKRLNDQFRLLLIAVDENAEEAQAFARRHGFDGPAILDKFQTIAKDYCEQESLQLPRTFLVSASGRGVAIYGREGADLEDLIQADLKALKDEGAPAAEKREAPTGEEGALPGGT